MLLGELVPAFGLGILATASPCALPLYPGFLAYLAAGAQSGRPSRFGRWLGVFVLAGVLTMMVALGALIAAFSLAVGQVLVFVTPLADLVVIGLGVALLLGANPFARLPALLPGGTGGGGAVAAYAYGLLYGPIALPCSGALLVSIFTLSLSVADFAGKLLFFLAFGLGFGVPLLAISLLAHGRQAALLRAFTRHYGVIGRVAGALLVAVGLYDLSVNLPNVLLQLDLAG
ncbi:MAG TPA: cytochrome c biogenesis protein CcdA [Candidatus Limnocylindrales bacterium]|nr:cytochrome c biogenesis protein CcdA [Candidatus Limnocylindrales bacterium]